MEKYLPPESNDVSTPEHMKTHQQGVEKLTHKQGNPVYWMLDPEAWNPGRLEAILRFMYLEGV